MNENLLDKAYEPGQVERRWYAFWEREQLFAAGRKDGKPCYSIVIPPPNVTGVLHMGHALNNTLQDILCRYRRLKGDNVLWMPGTDHAGIATQNVVEKKLAAEGTDRHQLGREKFIESVWEWREAYGSAIINQLKRLGASCDWDRERFTMDEGLSKAVRKVFVDLYHQGLIYRGDYIINWCHRCHTALADLEVEHMEHDGHLYHILYPFPGSREGIIVATTRPETMLGDTAVAVNPDDERYRGIPDEAVILPLMDRRIPVIRDKYVDMSFGTGGLKVTPAHDPNDFEIGRRHDLPSVKVIGDDGRMTEEAGRFAGMDRFECRKAVVEALEQQGLLKKVEAYRHSIGHCYRCNEIIEPNLSRQWFVKTKPLAEKAMAAVKDGRTNIIPKIWTKTYFDWMENIRDWCISRQIWWGHQIPAWTCQDCAEVIVAMDAPQACTSCGGGALVQESDVLDTWFSSALWPFSTMGWPDEHWLLNAYYPTSALVTGFDILFFWVARMMMMGIHFMGDVPFKDVYVHALVRDEEGKKMSKSTGNVIDPLTVIDAYGTDAFRFTLAAFAAQGRDIKMSEKRVEGYRHFINKIWNAARFALMHLTEGHPVIQADRLSLADRWILARRRRVVRAVAEAIDGYRFNDAAGSLYQFVWHEFCDWYLEMIKPDLYGRAGEERRQASQGVLWTTFRDTLILLHPFVPFITEELWHHLPGTEGSIMKAAYPAIEAGTEADLEGAENTMNLVIEVITGIRNIRGEMNIQPALALKVAVQSRSADTREAVRASGDLIAHMARLESLDVTEPGPKPRSAATTVAGDATVYVLLEGILDFSSLGADSPVRRAHVLARRSQLEAPAVVLRGDGDRPRGAGDGARARNFDGFHRMSPEEDEEEGDGSSKGPLAAWIAVSLAAIAVIGASIAILQTRASVNEANTARETTRTAVGAMRAGVAVEGAGLLEQDLAAAGGALVREQEALARRAGTGTAPLNRSQLESILPKDGELPGARTEEELRRLSLDSERLSLRQAALAETRVTWNDRSTQYTTTIAVLAFALFLVGFSLVLSGRRRLVFYLFGMSVALLAVAATIRIYTLPIPETSDGAINATARGTVASQAAEQDRALAAFDEAIEIDGDYAAPYTRRAVARVRRANPDLDGIGTVTDYSPFEASIADAQRALELGGDRDVITFAFLSFAAFYAGEYERSIRAADRAIEVNSEIVDLRLIKSAAEVGRGDEDAAAAAVDAASELLAGSDASERLRGLSARYLTYLEQVLFRIPEREGIVRRMAQRAVAGETGLSLDRPVSGELPGRGSVEIEGLRYSGGSFRLGVSWSGLPDGTAVSLIGYELPGPDSGWVQPQELATFRTASGSRSQSGQVAVEQTCTPIRVRVDVYLDGAFYDFFTGPGGKPTC